jgi:pimeloyl-ACP methyl ester carboxylesterase
VDKMVDTILSYSEEGSGPAVLLLHGMAGTGRSHFAPLIAALAANGFRAIAPDLLGHGQSRHLAPARGTELFTVHVASLVQVVEQLAPQGCHLVGYSDGGEIALQLAARLGPRAYSLCIWGVSGQVPPPAVVALYADPERQVPNWPAMRDELIALHGLAGPQLLTIWAEAMQELAIQGTLVDNGAAEQVRCRTLIISGDRDPFNPIEAVEALAQRIAGARLLRWPGAGHDLLAERGPQLIAVIRRFLGSVTTDD